MRDRSRLRSVRARATLAGTALVVFLYVMLAYAVGRIYAAQVERETRAAIKQATVEAIRMVDGSFATTGFPLGGNAPIIVYGPDGVPLSGGYTVEFNPATAAPLTLPTPDQIEAGVRESLAGARRVVHRLYLSAALGLPVIAAATAFGLWKLIGRAMRPVDAIRSQVEAISARTLHQRVPVPATGDEIARLAGTMNGMLDRLQRASAAQRQFVADASHELRSPIATIRAAAELARLHPDPVADRERLTITGLEAARLSGIVDNLLQLARIDESAHGERAEAVDLDELLLAEADRLRLLGVTVETDGVSAVRVAASRLQVAQALRNLVDNAARHQRERVRLAVSSERGTATVAVDDDGPGVPLADRARIFDRFTRLDEARSRDHGGSGLGLALVRAVSDAHAGDVIVTDSSLGGARFELRLPASR